MQYIGDTRIQALISYSVAGDDRLARQAIQAFNDSRVSDGITRSRYPTSVTQIIPTFSLLWVGMVHDFWRYRGDEQFVKATTHGHQDGIGLVHREAKAGRAYGQYSLVAICGLGEGFRIRNASE